MSLVQSLVLGVLQGIAEFLPISSSGHLSVAEHLMGLEELPPLFNVFLHLGTLCAVVIFFRHRIAQLLCALGRFVARRDPPLLVREGGSPVQLEKAEALSREKNLRSYIAAILITTAVTGAIGIFTEKLLGDMPLSAVFAGFLVTAALLAASAVVFAVRARRNPPAAEASGKSPSVLQALVIGLMQGVGTLPGISRSGSTISGALFCGVDRGMAGEYSFIASIPAVLGAFLLELKDAGGLGGLGAPVLAVGFMAAFVSGYAALALLMRIIRGGRLQWFACYLVPAGVLGLLFLGGA